MGKKELDLAKQLVGTLKGHFETEEFENTHKARLQETIQEKIGKEMGVSGGGGKTAKTSKRGMSDKSIKTEKEPTHSERHYHRKKAG